MNSLLKGSISDYANPREFGNLLSAERAKRDLKQSELAKEVGIGRVNISNYEKGQATPREKTYQQIRQALDRIPVLVDDEDISETAANDGMTTDDREILLCDATTEDLRDQLLRLGWKKVTLES